MTKSFYSHLLTMSLIHGFLFLGTWQVIKSEEVQKFVPKYGNGIIQMKVSSGLFIQSASPVKKIESVKKKISKMALPTPEVKTSPAPETQSTIPGSAGSVVGTGGNPNGHAFGTGNSNAKFSIKDIYKAELRATIEKNKYYPTMSRRLGQTGTVVIAFTLLEDGNIVDLRIEKPSQYERLNVSALDAVKKVERFKPIPKEVGEIRMDIKVPVKFVTI